MKVTGEDLAMWKGALRKGTYKQYFGAMHAMHGPNNERFCALGVFVNEFHRDEDIWGSPFPPHLTDYMSARLRDEVIRLNDHEEMSFPDIADWLDKHARIRGGRMAYKS